MRTHSLAALVAIPLLCTTAIAQETIGSWHVKAAPVTAVEVVNGGPDWLSYSTTNTNLDIQTAFTGFSIIDDGFANGQVGTTVEVSFTPGLLINQFGADLVLFDTFSFSDYAVSTEYDGFTSTVALPFASFSDTGEERSYYYKGLGPYAAFVRAAPIELSDLGIPQGVSIERVRLIAVSDEIDPLGLGIPCVSTCVFENYCGVALNSTGKGGHLTASGSASVAANNLTLTASNIPDQMTLFLYGAGPTQLPYGNGFLCVSGTITRVLPPMQASNHKAVLPLDLAGLGIAPGNLQFQCWFRDNAAGGASFNTTDALSIYFVP